MARRLFDAEEIQCYAENDGEFYSRYLRPTLVLLIKKLNSQQYDQQKALVTFRRIADLAAQSYFREMTAQEPQAFKETPWHSLFTDKERQRAADKWESEFRSRHRRGEYRKQMKGTR